MHIVYGGIKGSKRNPPLTISLINISKVANSCEKVNKRNSRIVLSLVNGAIALDAYAVDLHIAV